MISSSQAIDAAKRFLEANSVECGPFQSVCLRSKILERQLRPDEPEEWYVTFDRILPSADIVVSPGTITVLVNAATEQARFFDDL